MASEIGDLVVDSSNIEVQPPSATCKVQPPRRGETHDAAAVGAVRSKGRFSQHAPTVDEPGWRADHGAGLPTRSLARRSIRSSSPRSNHRPPTHTASILVVLRMSSSGFARSSTRSARIPVSIRPQSLAAPTNAEGVVVAASSAWRGVRPAATRLSSSRCSV